MSLRGNGDNLNDRELLLLKALIADSSKSKQVFSEVSGIGINEIAKKEKSFKELGLIRSFTVNVDYRKLGFGVLAFYSLKMRKRGDDEERAILAFLKGHHNVIEVLSVFGSSADYMVKIMCRELDEVERIANDITADIYNVDTDKSFAMIVGRTLKYESGPDLSII